MQIGFNDVNRLHYTIFGDPANAAAVSAVTFAILDVAGDLMYASAANTVAKLAIGTAGQVLRVNAGATAPEWTSQITLGTEQASTSGTSIDFTSIPAGVVRITIMLVGVSTNGTSNPLFQLGDSGGVEASSYVGSCSFLGATTGIGDYTTGFGINSADAGATITGALVLTLEDAAAFHWVASGQFTRGASDFTFHTVGHKALSAVLDRVRITTVNGTDVFDAGAINILYERGA